MRYRGVEIEFATFLWIPLPYTEWHTFQMTFNFYFTIYKIALGCTMFLVLKCPKLIDIKKIIAILLLSELALW